MSNCQYCNDELNNKRAKNCQTCNAILAEANKRGVYGFVMEAYMQAKSDSLSGEPMHDAMKSAIKFGQSKRNEWATEYRKQLKERRTWKPERFIEDAREDIETASKFRPAPRPEPEIYG